MPFGKDIIDGLKELHDILESDEKVSNKLTCRKVKLNLKPTTYTPEEVKHVRSLLNVSQSVFAEFIGVSLSAVTSWEQGDNPVRGASARLMDEIKRDPEYWRRRVLEMAEPITA